MDGLRLKKVRKERGYTQVTLAEALGVSKGSVTMWKTEYRYTDLFKLFFVLDEYGQNDVEALIHSQLQRCREQGTTKKTDHITVTVGIKKTEN